MNLKIDWFISKDQVKCLATCHDPSNIRKVTSGLT
jgi:hypothetical protein